RALRLREPVDVERESKAGLRRHVLAERVERRVAAAADRAGVRALGGECDRKRGGGTEDEARTKGEIHGVLLCGSQDGETARILASRVGARVRQNVAALWTIVRSALPD